MIQKLQVHFYYYPYYYGIVIPEGMITACFFETLQILRCFTPLDFLCFFSYSIFPFLIYNNMLRFFASQIILFHSFLYLIFFLTFLIPRFLISSHTWSSHLVLDLLLRLSVVDFHSITLLIVKFSYIQIITFVLL